MTRPFINYGLFGVSGNDAGPTLLDDFSFPGGNRIVLMAIQRALAMPAFEPARRFRLIAGGRSPAEIFDVGSPVQGAGPLGGNAFLPVPARHSGDASQFPRLVQGELLRDPAGRVYERIRRDVRLLYRPVSGPHGEILDLGPRVAPGSHHPPAPAELPAVRWKEVPAEEIEAARDPREDSSFRSPVISQGTKGRRARPICRKLFPEPGEWRAVRFGDFKETLSPQLAHSERLRDAHRLPCYVQVYELREAVRLEGVAAAELGGPEQARQLHPLTSAIALKLRLTPLPRRRPASSSRKSSEPGLLLPGERVFRLQIAEDPTLEAVAPGLNSERPSTPAVAPGAASEASAGLPSINSDGASDLAAAPVDDPSSLKSAIPELFFTRADFQFSRQEAIHQLRAGAGLLEALWRLFHRLRARIGASGAVRRWQIMLSGRSPDEQLWAIRPPEGSLESAAIREWARRTLELAGYESKSMLVEWEIFWRRKGL